jgi:hypothetical protein
LKTSRIALLVLASIAVAFAAPKAKTKAADDKLVDSGSYSILVDGKRVGSETFNITQHGNSSVTSSQIKISSGDTRAEQSSVLEMTSSGQLIRYAWKETSPEKNETTVDVTQTTVMQHDVLANGKKPIDLPYMISSSTLVLDDNFFSHRQVLVWRYLAEACKAVADKPGCVLQPLKLGVLVPAQHTPAVVSIEFGANEKLTVKGAERDTMRLKMMSADLEWQIWVDPADSYKIVRILVPANKTEVLRD